MTVAVVVLLASSDYNSWENMGLQFNGRLSYDSLAHSRLVVVNE